ncbi:MAG: hypothetical protein C7B43_00005 [Sulfobacillus benefaciens]|uniref:RRXRR domain-containing protein n=1 Tax=Sulfobacillus benefaciens TaxID=453960 RepID=A0A2T2XB20_9FIRM|nr:MAG: hypothetical protein C7B43_00005 [Sulfobacillus benefaciens]
MFNTGSQNTGVAIILEATRETKGAFFGQIVHKTGIKARLDTRRGCRYGMTRYRQPRFRNRQREAGWLPLPWRPVSVKRSRC